MDHPFLRFSNNVRERHCIAKVERLWARRHLIEPMRTLQMETLDLLGQQQLFEDLLTPPWTRLFAMAKPQYVELIIEFFASFQCTFPCPDLYNKKVGVSFRLGRKWNHQSMSRFGEVLGLYTDDEIDSEIFHDNLQEWEPTEDKAAFWAGITVLGRVWDPRRTKATWILDPLHRVIECAIFHIIGGRGDNTGNVSTRDLFHLFCIISGSDCNLVVIVAESIQRAFGSTPTSRICGGAFATRLSTQYGVQLYNLKLACDYGLVDLQQLTSMHMIRRVNEIPRLVDRLEKIWNPVPPLEGGGGDGVGVGGDDDIHMPNILVQGHEGDAGGAEPQLQLGHLGHDFGSPNWDNMYVGVGGGGSDYGSYGPYEPSAVDLWRRMDGLSLAQDGLSSAQEDIRRDVGIIRAEQFWQGNFLEYMYEQSRRSFEWNFCAQQHMANSPGIPYTQPPSHYTRRSRFDRRDDTGPSGSGGMS